VRSLPRALTLLGKSGYSLYAFHAPVLILLVTLGVAWPITLLAPIAVGVISFRFFERPLMVRGRIAARPAELVSVPTPT
jgi:peptidoglycan/LPS O-acetylase OafA/YrhL